MYYTLLYSIWMDIVYYTLSYCIFYCVLAMHLIIYKEIFLFYYETNVRNYLEKTY